MGSNQLQGQTQVPYSSGRISSGDAPAPRQPSGLDTLAKMLDIADQKIGALIQTEGITGATLSNVADALFGSRPQPVSSVSDEKERGGGVGGEAPATVLMQRLIAKLDVLERLQDFTRGELGRFTA